jgi:hypothetical protein
VKILIKFKKEKKKGTVGKKRDNGWKRERDF